MDPYLCSLIDQLEQEHTLSASQWIQLLNGRTPELAAYLFEKSRRAQIRFYGHTVYIRGLPITAKIIVITAGSAAATHMHIAIG